MSSTIINTPFTEEQVESLNAYQTSGVFHEYTCGNDDCPGKSRYVEGRPGFAEIVRGLSTGDILVATTEGWACPSCNYTQDWALTFMGDWSWKEMLQRIRFE